MVHGLEKFKEYHCRKYNISDEQEFMSIIPLNPKLKWMLRTREWSQSID